MESTLDRRLSHAAPRRPTGASLAVIVGLAVAGCAAGASTAANVNPATTASASPVASPTVPPILPGESWLAYQAYGGPGFGIRLIRPDGTGERVLFPPGSIDATMPYHPDWSPDGEQLAFSALSPAAHDIWTSAADGSNARQLGICGDCSESDDPAWSPDGKTIAALRQTSTPRGLVSSLVLYDIASAKARVVFQAPEGRAIFSPRWSPDGRQLLIEYPHVRPGNAVGDDFDGSQVAILDPWSANPVPRTITEPGQWGAGPDWSPAGDLIVFYRSTNPASLDDGTRDLWTVHPDGTRLTRITRYAESGQQASNPTFTPDGKRIVFVLGKVGGDDRIVTIAIDGSDLQDATATATQGHHPRFRPTP